MKIVTLFSFFVQFIFSLKIHVIPHSHHDPGWLRTLDEYYNQSVKRIYTNVLKQLETDKRRTFAICEMINFERWYREQSIIDQNKVKSLVAEGRIEFVGGGLVMNDQATSFYQDIIDQTRKGNQFIISEFGVKPEVSWNLDPFGHSAANSYLMATLGFKYNVLERIEFQEQLDRAKNGRLEFIWKPFDNKNNITIFSHILPYHYGTSFYFRYLAIETPVNKNDNQTRISNSFLDIIKERRSGFLHDEYMFLLGDDFLFNNENLFKKMEFIMEYVNNKKMFGGEKVEIVYSTPSKYFKSIEKKVRKLLLVEKDTDFFPYADKEYAYWSGYFTSRPYLKGLTRALSNLLLNSSKFLLEFILGKSVRANSFQELEKVIGLLQHHDAITGTAKERVNYDYIKIATSAIQNTTNTFSEVLKKEGILSKDTILKICLSNPIIDFGCKDQFLINSNSSKKAIVGVINPGADGKILVNLEMSKFTKKIKVFDKDNNEISSDCYCIEKKEFTYSNKCFVSFFLEVKKNVVISQFALVLTEQAIPKLENLPTKETTLIKNKNLIKNLEFSPSNLQFKLTTTKKESYTFSLNHGIYNGYSKESGKSKIKDYDGAYIFTPIEKSPIIENIDISNSFLFTGNLGTSVIAKVSNISYMIITVYFNPFFVKVDNIINPIKSKNKKNFVLVLNSDIKNEITLKYNDTDKNATQPEFWTDANGMDMMRRVTNYKHNYYHKFNERTSNNFYPVTTAISIREKAQKYFTTNKHDYLTKDDRMITIFTDRPEAGASLVKGEIQLLLIRSSLQDDSRGLGEPLYETPSSSVTFKISHFIMFGFSMFDEPNKGKTLTHNFVYNYFHNSPIFFNEPNLKDEILQNTVIKEIKMGDDVILNTQIVDDKNLILQFYKRHDYYFMGNDESDGKVSIKLYKDALVRIDKNGLDYFNLSKSNLRGRVSRDIEMYLKDKEFFFVYITLDY